MHAASERATHPATHPASERATHPPAAAVLDVNETLSDLDGLIPALAAHGLDGAQLRRWFAETLRDGFALTAAGARAEFSEIATSRLAAMLTAASDGTADGSAQEAAGRIVQSMAELELHPDVGEGLTTLHAAGVRIVTLSNGSAGVADSLLRRADLRDLVDQCLSVNDAARWKPAPEPYLYAAESCSLAPPELLLIAVHPWDVDGALRAGLRAAWLSRDGAPYPSYFLRPEATARSFPELALALTGQA